MPLLKRIFGKFATRRMVAAFMCAALLYFAAGGVFLHEHKGGNDTACHVCQALHLPALAPANAATVSIPEFLAWYQSRPVHAAPCEAFSFHHAGRAPPVA